MDIKIHTEESWSAYQLSGDNAALIQAAIHPQAMIAGRVYILSWIGGERKILGY